MDVTKILAELRAERAQLEEAILSLERLARGRGKRRGRPPAWLSNEPSEGGHGAPPSAKVRSAAGGRREARTRPRP